MLLVYYFANTTMTLHSGVALLATDRLYTTEGRIKRMDYEELVDCNVFNGG